MEWQIEIDNLKSEPGATLEGLCAGLGLLCASRGTLRKYRGCVHWHFKKEGEKGTLEATLWKGKLWLQMRANRKGAWTSAAVQAILDGFGKKR